MRWLLLLFAACGHPSTPAAPAPAGYVKGQLHVHTNNSGDSTTPPAVVARWYADHGFDFIVLTDHNRITSLPSPSADILVIPGVELTQNLEICDPPPVDACLLHVNALFVTADRAIRLPDATKRVDLYANAIAEARALGGIAQLNHPNFQWGADAALVTELVQKHGLTLFEVANESSDVANGGDATHPSTEALWDAVLTAGGKLYGTATDDAHNYGVGDTVDTGDRGWIMVHAPREVGAIRAAIERGDFYSTNGVTLRQIERTAEQLAIVADDEVDVAFIGAGGRVLARSHGTTARIAIPTTGYVRAVVTDARGRHAWVQP